MLWAGGDNQCVAVGGRLDPLRRGGLDWLLRQPDARHPTRLPAARLPG